MRSHAIGKGGRKQQKSHAQQHAGEQPVIRSARQERNRAKQAAARAAMRRGACAGERRAERRAGRRVLSRGTHAAGIERLRAGEGK